MPSASLVPTDPSVLFTTAGMQQFKRYYTGELDAKNDFGSNRVMSVQKCVRTPDIEEVGDTSHLTFFEMLGNFSFGSAGSDDPSDMGTDGYFKKSAISWAYAFLAERLHIEPSRMHVTVFEGDADVPRDEESYRIWKDIGLPKEKILLGKREDNFWGPTGTEGPCGPTTEIYVDGIEIWNIVFNEYYAQTHADGTRTLRKLSTPGIDTGMGLERLCMVLEGKKHVYEASPLANLLNAVTAIAPEISERDARIITDHARSAAFMISDGIRPSNKDAGYVLRRLLRKIMGLSIKNDIHQDAFKAAYEAVSRQYGHIYEEIRAEREILAVWDEEREKFDESIRKGLMEVSRLAARKEKITGADAFKLYESYGIPFELLKEVLSDDAYASVSKSEFDEAFRKHQEISRAGAEKKFGGHGLALDTGELKAGSEEEVKRVIRMHTATHLLHWALRKNIGESVRQKGSDITPERLRFDFNLDRKLTDEELKKIEADVNEQIRKDLPVYSREMPKSEADASGALHYFNEKYPDTVKVYYIGPEGSAISAEFCNGPHVAQTRDIGTFRILKQESLGKDAKRIRATVVDE